MEIGGHGKTKQLALPRFSAARSTRSSQSPVKLPLEALLARMQEQQ